MHACVGGHCVIYAVLLIEIAEREAEATVKEKTTDKNRHGNSRGHSRCRQMSCGKENGFNGLFNIALVGKGLQNRSVLFSSMMVYTSPFGD
jgi:hypothetical protein